MQLSKGRAQPHHSPRPPPRVTKGHRSSSSRTLRVSLLLCAALAIGLILSTAGRPDPGQSAVQHSTGRKHKHDPMLPRHRSSRRRQKKQNDFHDRDGDGDHQAEVHLPAARHEHEDDRREHVNDNNAVDEEVTPAPTAPAPNHPLTFEEVLLAQKQTSAKPAEEYGAAENQQGEAKPTDNAAGTDNAVATDELQPRPKKTKAALGISWLTSVWRNIHDSLLTYHHGSDASANRGDEDGDRGGDGETDQEDQEGGRRSIGGRRRSSRWSKLEEALHSVPLFPVIDDIVATTASASRSKSSIDHINNKHERDVKDNPIEDNHLRESVSSFEDLPFPFSTRRFSGHDVRQTRTPLFEWRRRHSGLVFMTTVKPCTEGDELFRTHVAAISSWLAVSISKAPKDMGWGSNKKRRRRVFGPWPSKSPKKPKTRTTNNLNELNENGRENGRQPAEIEKKRASRVRSGSHRFQEQSIESAVPDFSARRSAAAASSHASFDHTGDMSDLLFPLSSAFSMFERVGRENRSFTSSNTASSTSPSNLKANLRGASLRFGEEHKEAKETREDEDEDARLARAFGRRWINEVTNARSPFYVTREDDTDNAADEAQLDRPFRHQRVGGGDEPDARGNTKGRQNHDVGGDHAGFSPLHDPNTLAGSSPLHEEGEDDGEEWDSEGYFEYVSGLSPVVVIADGESPSTEERQQRSQHDASVLRKRRDHHQAPHFATEHLEQIPSLDENDKSSILVNSALQWLKRVTGTPLSEDFTGTLQQELHAEINAATTRPTKSCAALLTKYFQRPDVLDAILSTDAQRRRAKTDESKERSQNRQDGRVETEDDLTSGERALRPVLRPFVYHTADPTFQGKHGTVLLGPLFRHVVGSLFPSAATFCFINTDIILDPQSTSAVLEKTQRSFTDYFITGHRHTVDLRAPGLMRRAFPEAFATSASASPSSASFSSSSFSASSFSLKSARFSDAPENTGVETDRTPMRDSGSSVERVTKRVLQHFLRLKLVSTTEALHILHHLLPHHNNSEPHLGETMSSKNIEMRGNGNTADMTSSEEALDFMTAGTLSLEALDHRAFMELLLPKRPPGQHQGSHHGRHYHPHGHRVGNDTTTSKNSSDAVTSVSFEFWRCVLRGEASYHRRRWRSHELSADKAIPTGKVSRFTRLSPQHIRHCLSAASLHKQHQSIIKKTSVVHAGGVDPKSKSQTSSSSNEFGRLQQGNHRKEETRSVDVGRANNAVSSVAASLEHLRIAGLRHTVWRWFNEPQELDRLSPESKSMSEDNTVSSSRRDKALDQARGRPDPTTTSQSSLMDAMMNGTLDRFFLSPQSLHRYKDRTDAEDYFFFSRTFFDLKAIPAFHIGRPAYDNWLVHHAIHRGCPAVDASGAIRAVHLKHGYGHLKAVREMAAKRRQLQQIDAQDRELKEIESLQKDVHDSHVDDAITQVQTANRREAARTHAAINRRRLQEATTPKPQSYWASAEQKENYRLGEQHGGWQHGLLDRLPWTWREVTSFSSFKRAIKTLLLEKPGDISRALFERLFGDLVFADVFEHLDASSGARGSVLVGSTPDKKARQTVVRLDGSANQTADLILKKSAFFGGDNRDDEHGGKVVASLRAMLHRDLAAGLKAQLERRLTEEETERQQHFAENLGNKRPTTPRTNVQTQQRSSIGTSSATPPQLGSSLRVNRRKVDFTADTISAVLSGLQKISSSSSPAGSGLFAFAFDLRTGRSRGRSSDGDGDAQEMVENTRRGRQTDLTPLGLNVDQETIVNQTLALFASPSLDHCYVHLAWLREKETKEQAERLKQFGNRPAGRNGKREEVATEHTEESFIHFVADLRSKSGAHTQRSSLIDQLWLGTESTREPTISLAPCALLSLRRDVHLEVPEDKSWRSRGLAGPLGLGSRADHGRQCAASYGDEATRDLLRRLLLVSW